MPKKGDMFDIPKVLICNKYASYFFAAKQGNRKLCFFKVFYEPCLITARVKLKN